MECEKIFFHATIIFFNYWKTYIFSKKYKYLLYKIYESI